VDVSEVAPFREWRKKRSWRGGGGIVGGKGRGRRSRGEGELRRRSRRRTWWVRNRRL